MTAPADFFKETLLRGRGEVYVCALPNVKGKAKEVPLLTRDPRKIAEFVERHDGRDKALYFCVSTIRKGERRRKENAVQTAFIHADVDLKNIAATKQEVIERLRSLPVRPSRVHFTGNGFHCFWYLEQPTDDFERVEALLKRLKGVLGSDPAVCHSVAFLRIPGSHNTKDPSNKKRVETLISAPSRTYSLGDLEEWLEAQPPVILARGKTVETNPFLKAAEQYSFKPAMDVDRRLAEMTPGGEGDSAVHITQLEAIASLLSGGWSEEDAVAKVLEATKLVAPRTWNWKTEEKGLTKMAEDWHRKHPEIVTVRERRAAAKSGGAVVVNLAEKRAEKQAEVKTKKGKAKAHVVLGSGILEALEERGEKIMLTQEQLWRYRGGLWTAMSPGEAKNWIEHECEVGCRLLNIVSKQTLVNETRSWLGRSPEVYREAVEWDVHGKIPTRSGLLDPRTKRLEKIKPEHLVTYRVECEYDPEARCPWWLRMLDDVFQDRPKPLRRETIAVLQEVLGAALLERKPRNLMRALVLVGPSDSGKSTLLNVLGGLICERTNSTPFDALENAHGLVGFLRRAPWVLHEAFDASKWHLSAIVKSLLSGDAVNVNIKNGPMVTHQFRNPVFWGTNSPPQFKEATKAIVNRMIIVPCHRVFEEATGAAVEAYQKGYSSPSDLILSEERSGLLNWALEGMERALQRGTFSLTTEMQETLHQVRTDSNLVAGFIEECCDYDRTSMVTTPDFCAAFSLWWSANRGEGRGVPSNDSIGRAMIALSDPRIGRRKSMAHRFYTGIRLNEIGLDYWQGVGASNLAAGKLARLSTSAADVNKSTNMRGEDQ